MIIGQFTWRKWEIEAESITSPLVGEVIWLNRTGPAPVGIGMIRDDRLELTAFAPADDLAPLELRHAFDEFRSGTTT
ncbi:hypothetical protein [Glycomyces terrestris]|uniref:Uncharacterized protein n=1 Tax=Glycomyces terrestris TaxID=2493553 RepID=A0A426UV62_9ACTN|nr:hypothetical protein [Glycomyces terrestris]RRR98212.1 hypothetical protein EIW28_14940 [Glycomyces terrestris]